jgi:acetyl-CoA C-acetyltransferase
VSEFPRNVAIAGVYEHPSRFSPDKTEFQIMAECTRGALDDAGLERTDIDGLFGASMTMGMMGIVDLAEYLDLKPDYIDGSNIGGSSFVSHVNHAAAAINAGMCTTALVLYGSTSASNSVAIGTGMGGGSKDPAASFNGPYGMTTVGSYAMYANLHMQKYGTTSEQLAEIAVTMRHHASLNPLAKMRTPITVDDVMSSRVISSPLHLLDCCIISDGGGAVIVTSHERAKDLAKTPVRLLGCAEAVTHQEVGQSDLLTIAAKQSGERAMGMAGVTHSDLDLAMIYDSFTITVLATLENLGFCGRGEGGDYVSRRIIRVCVESSW